MSHFIIGTAGHIDHGKTSLVRALTGTDTDVLKEEKARNITIDIGFAFMGEDITIIDVPGHEKFIKNMMAGVSTIDFVLFVIAADDGIMPQTREHLDILNLLQVKDGFVVLTKAGMVEKDWIELVKEEVVEHMKGTFLEDKEIFTVDSISGDGIEDLKSAVLKKRDKKPLRKDRGIFKLPVDRVFSMKGFGTIVTGTVLSGTVNEGDKISLQPQNREIRVKGLQCHGENRSTLQLGDRAAVNLHGIGKEEIERGNVLVSTGYLEPTYIFSGKLHLLSSAKKIKNRTRVRVHAGTNEVFGRVVLLDNDELNPGSSCFAEFRLEEKMNISPEERFVIRTYSPQITIGGGIILTINEKKTKRYDSNIIKVLTELEQGDRNKIIEEIIYLSKNSPLNLKEISRKAAWSEKQTETAVNGLTENEKIVNIGKDPKKEYYHKENFEDIKSTVTAILKNFHKENAHQPGMSKEELRSKISRKMDQELFDTLLKELSKNRIDIEQNTVSLKGFTVKIDTKLRDTLADISELYSSGEFKPPLLKEIVSKLQISPKEARQYTGMLASEGKLVKIDTDLYFSAGTFEKGMELIKRAILSEGHLKVGRISEILGSSRKYTIPFVEFLDRKGFTRRNGDVRELGE